MQTQKIDIAQTQTGTNKKTQDRGDSRASLRYSTTLLWQEGHKGAYIECRCGCGGGNGCHGCRGGLARVVVTT